MNDDFLHSADVFLIDLGFHKEIFEYKFPLYVLNKQHILLISLEDLRSITQKNFFSTLKLRYIQEQHINLIFLWEDRWMQQSEVIKLRLKTLLGNFTSVPARKTTAKKVSKSEQITFIEGNHFYVFGKAPFSYGLYLQDELLAIATFDRPRKWKRENGTHVSIELVRFACKSGYIVVGGLSKLIKVAAEAHSANDIMTFIDTDWSDGSGFEKVGFEEISHTGPIAFYVNPETFERIHLSVYHAEMHAGWILVHNTGSFKMVKQITAPE